MRSESNDFARLVVTNAWSFHCDMYDRCNKAFISFFSFFFFFFFCIFPSFYEKISGIYLRDRSITRVSMIKNMLVRSNLDSLWSCFLLLLSLSRVVDDL